MCCHLNGFAPLGRRINSVISVAEVTKGWQGSLYLQVDPQYCCHYSRQRWHREEGDLSGNKIKNQHLPWTDAVKSEIKWGATLKKHESKGGVFPPIHSPITSHHPFRSTPKSNPILSIKKIYLAQVTSTEGAAEMMPYILKSQVKSDSEQLNK